MSLPIHIFFFFKYNIYMQYLILTNDLFINLFLKNIARRIFLNSDEILSFDKNLFAIFFRI